MKVTIPMVIDLVDGLNRGFQKDFTGASFYPLSIEVAPVEGGAHFVICFLGEPVTDSRDHDPDDPPTLEDISKEVLEELKSIKIFLDHVVKH